jgi:hypothetical protein
MISSSSVPVVAGDVLDVARVLVAALDLEAATPASMRAARLALWLLSFTDSRCLSKATTRPWSSWRV